ncbi:DUF1501 domain-containing protein [Prosthecobacter sp.]|uniref:DUF1501 domain-containing protein n=1 Tax=Prosthecobacter sp. TaxID=1965333 RepID=UPI0037833A6A
MDRRAFLTASTMGLASLRCGPALRASTGPALAAPTLAKPAKSTVLFFLCGGASHIDMWDMKPEAPLEYRGEFKPIRTTGEDIRLCEHLPLLAKQAHNFSVVHGITDGGQATGDHHAGYYYNLTGHVPDITFKQQGNDRRPYPEDWPYMGSVVAMKRPPHPSLPSLITLPHKPSKLPFTRPGQFAGRIGMEHDPFFLNGSFDEPLKFAAPTISMSGSMTAQRMHDRKALLAAMNDARRELDHEMAVQNYVKQQERAFDLLSSSSTSNAFDIQSEPDKLRERYGHTINGTSLLMARRLVEAGVPFVTVFWKEDESTAKQCKSAGGWDTHGDNFNCLRKYLLPKFDQAFSAFLEDLSGRGLLDETLVLVTSEMGRTPKIGDRRSGGTIGAGRDHWTACMSVLMAGAGIRGGQVVGETDARAELPKDRPIRPEDITKTVYYAMGIKDLEAKDKLGRAYNLLDEGKPLTELFG